MKDTSKDIVTIETKHGIVYLNGYASESARIYIDLLVEACKRRKIDPRDALLNTDEYPQLHRSESVEFAIGWLHGVAEAYELVAEQIFDAVIPRAKAVVTKKRPAKVKVPAKRAA